MSHYDKQGNYIPVSMISPSVCQHGQLARSCNICELETELATLRAENALSQRETQIARKALAEAEAEIAELRKDKERIDYLELNPRNAEIFVEGKSQPCLYYAVAGAFGVRLRAIIDAAIDAERKETT